MSVDKQSVLQQPNAPTPEAVSAQVDRLCKDELIDGKRRPHLLKFLIDKENEGYFRSTPPPIAKKFYADFYEHENSEFKVPIPGKTDTSGRQLIHELKDALEAYYRGPGMHDPVLIEVLAGRQGAPRPHISSNPRRRNDSVPLEQELAIGSAQVKTSGQEPSQEESHLMFNTNDWALDLNGKANSAKIYQTSEWSVEEVETILRDFAHKFASKSDNAIHSSSGDDEIRIWTTFMRFPGGVDALFYKLVKLNVKVKILILNPENDGLVRGKYRLREEPLKPELAKEKLKDQIIKIRRIADDLRRKNAKGSLAISECDSIPFGVFYQLGNRVMLVGYALPLDAWTNGPLVKIYPGSKQWDILKENWESCWDKPLD
jgi:hypothetical protein